MKSPVIMVSQQQQRRLRASIAAEVRHYQHCLALLPGIPAEVVDAGRQWFQDEGALARWLCLPARSLGEKTPMELAQTRRGAARVAELLRAIAHGVYR